MTPSPIPAATQPMKVTLLCHSDKLGGASVVTYRLMRALRDQGVDARMLVFNKQTYDTNVAKVGSRFMRGIKFMAERLRILAANGFSRENLFKVSIADTGFRLSRHPWVRQADVVVLSWINQGMMSLNELKRLHALGKPLVWTMHDMWTLTGICHHAHECTRFEQQCGRCPLLGSSRDSDLSNKIWRRKRDIYDKVPVTFVTVSNWLEQLAQRSSLMKGCRVVTIPNAFPAEKFHTSPHSTIQRIPVDYTRKLIVMGAARLDDPIKNLPAAVEALNEIFDNHPEVANSSMAVFFGALKDPSAFDGLRFPYIHLGMLNDEDVIRELYSGAKVVLSTSHYETLPGTLIEGLGAGCIPVTTGRGGQGDIVEHLVNGYIVPDPTPSEIAKGLLWALEQDIDRDRLHDSVKLRFDASVVANRFKELFQSLVSAHPAPSR